MCDENNDVVDALLVCERCGAEQPTLKPRCWLCGADFKEQADHAYAKYLDKKPEFATNDRSYLLLLLLPCIAIGLVVIGIGFFQVNPIFGLFYTAVAVFVFAVLVVALPIFAFRGESNTPGRQAAKATFITLGGIFGALLLAASAVILLFAACVNMMQP